MTSMATVSNGANDQISFFSDRPMAVGSQADGDIEFLMHRRTSTGEYLCETRRRRRRDRELEAGAEAGTRTVAPVWNHFEISPYRVDDWRGVEEPLDDQTEIRPSLYLHFSTVQLAETLRPFLELSKRYPPALAHSTEPIPLQMTAVVGGRRFNMMADGVMIGRESDLSSSSLSPLSSPSPWSSDGFYQPLWHLQSFQWIRMDRSHERSSQKESRGQQSRGHSPPAQGFTGTLPTAKPGTHYLLRFRKIHSVVAAAAAVPSHIPLPSLYQEQLEVHKFWRELESLWWSDSVTHDGDGDGDRTGTGDDASSQRGGRLPRKVKITEMGISGVLDLAASRDRLKWWTEPERDGPQAAAQRDTATFAQMPMGVRPPRLRVPSPSPPPSTSPWEKRGPVMDESRVTADSADPVADQVGDIRTFKVEILGK